MQAVERQSAAGSAFRAAYERLLGPGILFLIVVLFYWKLVLTNQYTWLESPDLANMILPWFQFQAGEWSHGRFPMWDPNSWFGLPLFGQGEPGSAYPLNWLLFLVPLKHGWIRQAALHWYAVLIHYGAALTCYALARDLGRSRAASILAGCVYALGGFVAFTGWPQHVNGAVWSPLVLLYLFRAERGERPWASALLSGFFLGFGWLAGHHQMNLLVSLAAAGIWIWLCLRHGRPDWRMARLAACSIVIAIFTSAFQTIPMAEYGRAAIRWVGLPNPVHLDETVPYSMHQDFALKPLSVLGIIIPNLEPRSISPYVGVVAFSLALLGLILAWRERQVRWLAAVCAGALLYALGPNSVFHGMIYSLVPLVEKARVPGEGTVLLALGMAPLAAYGLDLLPRPESFEWSRWMGWALAGIAAVLTLMSLSFYAARVSPATDDRLMVPALAAAAAAGAFAAARSGALSARGAAVVAIGLALFELGNVTNYFLPTRYDPAQNPYLHRLAEHADLADYIRNRGLSGRVEYDDQQIPYNFGTWHGIETMNAYGASVLDNVWQLNPFPPSGKNFFGVRYYIGKSPQRPELKEVFTGRSGLKVFENLAVFPRVWSVHRAVSMADPQQLRAAFWNPQFDPLRTVLLAEGPAPDFGGCAASQEEDVQMPLRTSNYVRITANLKCRGMVILTDTWFPGWRATVDGKSARIYQAYSGVRGVVVDGGAHVVEMRYRPLSVIIGGLMTALAAAITMLVRFRLERRS